MQVELSVNLKEPRSRKGGQGFLRFYLKGDNLILISRISTGLLHYHRWRLEDFYLPEVLLVLVDIILKYFYNTLHVSRRYYES